MPLKDNIFSVTEVTRHVKNILENSVPSLVVEGEISNFISHGSGHIYFSLKDENSSLRCVFFRNQNIYLEFNPANGDKVLCRGRITVYEKSGNYQLTVQKMYPAGIGELQIKFDELKKKLAAEGLFDDSRKKDLPRFPNRIGVITSATGAAIQDIRNVLARRYPCRIFLYPATVQGAKAPEELIAGLEYFTRTGKVDVIIIGRGGGSQEDLFCFNDENLARAISGSEIPVISAVGHEIDFTIADLVADLRAPTPSAAAEMVVPEARDLIRYLDEVSRKLILIIKNNFSAHKLRIHEMETILNQHHPRNILQSYQQRLDEAALRLNYRIKSHMTELKTNLEILATKLSELSPYEALKRGYSMVIKQKRILNSVTCLESSDLVELLLRDGKARCQVKDIEPRDPETDLNQE